MQLKRVLICDNVHKVCSDTLQKHGVEAVVKDKMTKEELLKEIQNCDGLIVRSATKVTEEVIEAGKNLKLIGRAGVGVDNINCPMATKKGILVMNTPTGNTISAAEHTCAMISCLARQVPRAAASLKSGAWDRKMFMGDELYNKTLAIVGLGNIGREVGKRMQAFGMRTIGFDPIVPAEIAEKAGIEKMELEELWPLADYITVHTPLIPQTKNMINADVFSKCKKGVRVINVARGGIVDEKALLEALQSEECGGAGLDVFLEEPPKDLTLVSHPKVIPTPHLGANTKEAQYRVAEEITKQFVDFIKAEPLSGLVNAPALRDAYTPGVKSWITLGQVLSKLIISFAPEGTESTFLPEIVLYGENVSNYEGIVRTAVLSGLVVPMIKSAKVNLVNAPILAKEAGITAKTTSVTKPPSGISCCKALTISLLKNGVAQYSVTGCIREAVVVFNVNGADFSNGVTMEGNMLFFQGDSNSFQPIINDISQKGITINTVSRSAASKDGGVWYAVRVAEDIKNYNFKNTSITVMAKMDF